MRAVEGMVAFEPPVLSEDPHTFESLRLFNEVNTTVAVLDPSNGVGFKVVWANAAARDWFNGQSSARPTSMENVIWEAHNTTEHGDVDRLSEVQERHTVLKMRIKVGPMDGKVLLDCTFRPLHLRGEAEGQDAPSRTVVLMTGQPAAGEGPAHEATVRRACSAQEEAARRAADQLDWVRESLLLCERTSGEILTANFTARQRYEKEDPQDVWAQAHEEAQEEEEEEEELEWGRLGSIGALQADMSPAGAIGEAPPAAKRADGPECGISNMKELLETYALTRPEMRSLMIQVLALEHDASISLELQKSESESTWYDVAFTCISDPITGKDVTLIMEHDISAAKRSEWLLLEHKKRNDTLLYSMLPKHIVNALQEGRRVQGSHHEGVSVLFTDVVGFTSMSALCHSSHVCDLLDSLFTVFDTISEHFNHVEKLKTVGDAYMIASGLFSEADQMEECACQAVDLALALIEGAAMVKFPHDNSTVQIRAGVHLGDLMSGVVGLRMPQFTVFGDTVNTASRMESNGEPGKVHVTGDVARILQEKGYSVVRRGMVFCKGKGEIETYWVEQPPDSRLERITDALSAAEDAMDDLLAVRVELMSPMPHGSSRRSTQYGTSPGRRFSLPMGSSGGSSSPMEQHRNVTSAKLSSPMTDDPASPIIGDRGGGGAVLSPVATMPTAAVPAALAESLVSLGAPADASGLRLHSSPSLGFPRNGDQREAGAHQLKLGRSRDHMTSQGRKVGSEAGGGGDHLRRAPAKPGAKAARRRNLWELLAPPPPVDTPSRDSTPVGKVASSWRMTQKELLPSRGQQMEQTRSDLLSAASRDSRTRSGGQFSGIRRGSFSSPDALLVEEEECSYFVGPTHSSSVGRTYSSSSVPAASHRHAPAADTNEGVGGHWNRIRDTVKSTSQVVASASAERGGVAVTSHQDQEEREETGQEDREETDQEEREETGQEEREETDQVEREETRDTPRDYASHAWRNGRLPVQPQANTDHSQPAADDN